MNGDEYKVRIGKAKMLIYHPNRDEKPDADFIRDFQEAACSNPQTIQDFFIRLSEIQQNHQELKKSEMQIKLKNIKVSEHMSEETTAFTADLYVNNKKIAFVKNDGHGGSTDYRLLDKDDSTLLQQAEEYCKSLPPIVYPGASYTVGPLTIQSDLESQIDSLLDSYLKKRNLEKFQKKMQKHQEDSILYGIPDIEYRNIKFRKPIAEMMKTENGQTIIKRTIQEIFTKLRPNDKILNTNLPPEYLSYERKQVKKPLTTKEDDLEKRPRLKR